jgi:hypothetical protein
MRRLQRPVLVSLLCATFIGRDVCAQDTTQANPPAILIGTVVDSAGNPLAGAEVSLMGSETIRTITSDSGAFRLTGIPAGTVVFAVRRLGYEGATFTATLKPGRTHRAQFPLTGAVARLATVGINDTMNTHWLDQFEARRSSQRGTFMTRKEIEKKSARNGSDLVRSIPGIRVASRSNGTSEVSMTRAAGAQRCLPQMFVHGVPYSGTLDDFPVDDIEALEVYVGISEIPAELNRSMPTGLGARRSGMSAPCAVIVVWTRDPRRRP